MVWYQVFCLGEPKISFLHATLKCIGFEKANLWQEIFFELWQSFELLVPHKCLWFFKKSENVQEEIQTLRKGKSLAGDFTGDQLTEIWQSFELLEPHNCQLND